MSWTPQQADCLWTRIRRGGRSEGHESCPTDEQLVQLALEQLDAETERQVRRRVEACPECRAELSEIAGGLAWFRERETETLAHLAQTGAAAGLAPWRTCPTDEVLRRFARDELGDTEASRRLAATLRGHVKNCLSCEARVAHLLTAEAPDRVSLRDLADRAAAEVAGWVETLVHGLRAALASGPAPAYAVAGYRATHMPRVRCPVLAADGELMLQSDGTVLERELELSGARIDADGRLAITLHVPPDSPPLPAGACRVEAALSVPGLSLDLPAQPLEADGEVCFAGVVPGADAIDALPASALRVRLRQMSEDGQS